MIKIKILMLVLFVVIASCAIKDNRQTDVNNIEEAIGKAIPVCTYIKGVEEKGHQLGLIINAVILSENSEKKEDAVFVRFNGKIGAVGKYRDLILKYNKSSILDCGNNAILSPGFINPHEHLGYSYEYPDPKLQPIYQHRDEWRLGLNNNTILSSPKSFIYRDRSDSFSNAKLIWIELRHLIAGTTCIGSSGGVPGLAKNVNIHKYKTDPLTFRNFYNILKSCSF